MIKDRLSAVKARIHETCSKIGRKPEEVKLLLATKSAGAKKLQACLASHHSYFGENRVQDLLKKMQDLDTAKITWDFIGHLQSNKAKDIVNKVNLIHSVDRLSLITALDKRATKKQKILIEINTSGEKTKSGVGINDYQKLLVAVLASKHLDFAGLMTIASNTENEKEVRSCFTSLYKARVQAAKIANVSEASLELSMGMSSDFEWAIEEGATIIRIGSLVLGERA